MIFEKVSKFKDTLNDLKISYISLDTGGFISGNNILFDLLEVNNINKYILKKAILGSPIFKIGEGGKKILILSGVHGNELPSQIASLKLINNLLNLEISETIYIIPFLAPNSTMKNYRTFDSKDLNRFAHIKDSLSYNLIKKIKELDISAVGDFHSTALDSNPGRESIFYSEKPTSESFLIANHIYQDIGSELIGFSSAGTQYKGAIEDQLNLNNIPAITCEVLSPFGSVGPGSIERAYLQMRSFLSYFGI